MAGRELGCVSETVRVRLAPGWRPMTADELPAGLLRGTQDTVRYIAAAVPQTRAYAPNLVVVRTPLGVGEDPGAVLVGSGRAIVDAIAGVRMIDECPAEHLHEGGRLRSGIYILDETALTFMQLAWIQQTLSGGACLWTATFTCATREFGAYFGHMYEMSRSLEVVA